jgi:hypothetical protein
MRHLNTHAFVINLKNAWLTPDDIPELVGLSTAYFAQKLCGRITSALWYFEATARSYYIDTRWPLLATCLEALVHIRDERLLSGRYAGSTKVFVERLLSLAQLDVNLSISEEDLRTIYGWRSHLAHGRIFGNIEPEQQRLYSEMESFARKVLKKAILDRVFHDIFATDQAIEAALPLQS